MEQPITLDGLTILAFQAIFLALIIERVVGQIKKLSQFDRAKPWPVVASALSLAVVFAYDLPLIEYVTGVPGSKTAWFLSRVLFGLWIAGGSAAIVDTIKKAAAKRDELHQIKVAK